MPDEEQSPAQKAQSACGLCCAGWLIFPLTLLLLGYNEKSFVCTQKNILMAEKDAEQVACDSKPEDDKFIALKCALDECTDKAAGCSFKEFTLDTFNLETPEGKNLFGDKIKFKSLSARMEPAEMFQCIETSTKVKEDKNCQDDPKNKIVCPTKTIYEYQQAWARGVSKGLGKDKAKRDMQCPGVKGKENPDYPKLFSEAAAVVHPAREVKLKGNFYLTQDVHKSPHTFKPDAPVDLSAFASKFANKLTTEDEGEEAVFDAKHVVVKGNFLQTCHNNLLGCVRVHFMKNTDTGASIIANSGTKGRTTVQKFGASWGCSAGTYVAFYKNEMLSKDEIINKENDSNDMALYVLRVAGILLAWAAMYCCMYPIVAFSDIMDDYVAKVPCIGPILSVISGIVEWLVTIVVCCMSCSFGCSAAAFTITVVWLVMKPPWESVGRLLFCAVLVTCAFGLAYLAPKKEAQARDLSVELNNQA